MTAMNGLTPDADGMSLDDLKRMGAIMKILFRELIKAKYANMPAPA